MVADTVTALTGVHHADGSVIGELRYWIGARLGRAHCALCDITHGGARWRAARADRGPRSRYNHGTRRGVEQSGSSSGS